MKDKIVCWLFLAVATIGAGGARADQSAEITTELIAEVRESTGAADARRHRLVPARQLAQGQEVFYTLRVRNPTPLFARDVIVSQPIPENTIYVPGSAAGPGTQIDFSVDGGKTFARPEDLFVQGSGARRARPEDYTHIRWRLRNSLAPGAVALVRFRAVFN